MSKPVVYPSKYYDFIRRVTKYCVPEKKTENSEVENIVFGGILFFGELGYSNISEQTYYHMWNSLCYAIQYKRDDLVLLYWRNAHQYKSFYINYNNEVSTKEKERFIEIHLVVGAFLLESKRYECLNKILYYTNSLPPSYVLFPTNLNEIFNWFEKFLCFNKDYIFIESKYPIEKYKDVYASDNIKSIISEYLVLLIFRHISLPDYYIYESHDKLPEIPNTEVGLYNWKENVIPFITKSLNKIKNIIIDNNIIQTDENSIKIEDFISKLELIVSDKYSIFKIEQEIDNNIELAFRNSTSTYINDKIKTLLAINNDQIFESSLLRKLWYKKPIHKGAFAKNQHISYGNIDDVFSEILSYNFNTYYSLLFPRISKKRYLINEENIIDTLKKIIGSNSINFQIIACRTSLDYWISINKSVINKDELYYLKTDNNTEIPIFNLWNCHPNLYQTFYVIEKTNLPTIRFEKPDITEILKYKLEPYDESLNLYGNVIDLKDREDLHIEIPQQEANIKEYAYVCLELTPIFYFNSDAEVVEIQVFDRFDNKGVPNAISEVKSWEDIFPKKEEKEEDK